MREDGAMVPLHLGGLHPFEQALIVLLAFGPFVVLGVVLVVRHRQDRQAGDGAGGQATQRDR